MQIQKRIEEGDGGLGGVTYVGWVGEIGVFFLEGCRLILILFPVRPTWPLPVSSCLSTQPPPLSPQPIPNPPHPLNKRPRPHLCVVAELTSPTL